MENNDKYITVSVLSDRIKDALEDYFPGTIYVKGEISGFKPSSTGHWYLTVKDDESVINAIIFKNIQASIIDEFRSAGISSIKDGQEVLIEAKINLYKKGGSYSLIITKMSPLGIGGLYLKFEKLKRELAEKGLFDSGIKKGIPAHPAVVGIITSPTGAALQDMLNVLKRRAPGIEIKIFPVSVQGENAKNEIVKAIQFAGYHYKNNTDKKVDVLIIARGGGSIEDLWPFNEEVVAYAIHKCPIPIISGIGHEIDFTIADFCADLRAPTPSAAAELVARSNAEVINNISSYHLRLQGAMRSILQKMTLQYERVTAEKLGRAFTRIFEVKMQDLLFAGEKLHNGMDNILVSKKHRFELAYGKIKSLSPVAILERGYAVVYNSKDGKVVKNTDGLNIGDTLNIVFNSGKAVADVKSVAKA